MKRLLIGLLSFSLLAVAGLFLVVFAAFSWEQEEQFVSYIVDPHKTHLAFYWKDEKGEAFGNISNLKSWLKKDGKKLKFAMNAGIYGRNLKPLGLYIENGIMQNPLNVKAGNGNFFMPPRGVFYLTRHNYAVIKRVEEYSENTDIEFAIQSGPMLLIDGVINESFNPKSNNKYIRNGVGLLPDNRIIFAISTSKVSLYEFAQFFKKNNCTTALYMDGYISQMYLSDMTWQANQAELVTIIAESNSEKRS